MFLQRLPFVFFCFSNGVAGPLLLSLRTPAAPTKHSNSPVIFVIRSCSCNGCPLRFFWLLKRRVRSAVIIIANTSGAKKTHPNSPVICFIRSCSCNGCPLRFFWLLKRRGRPAGVCVFCIETQVATEPTGKDAPLTKEDIQPKGQDQQEISNQWGLNQWNDDGQDSKKKFLAMLFKSLLNQYGFGR